jgi:hypothetical protein
MSDDGLCPRCRNQLNPDLGTAGWIDADGKKWMGMTVLCPQCDVHFGRDNSGNWVEASAIIPTDDELDP